MFSYLQLIVILQNEFNAKIVHQPFAVDMALTGFSPISQTTTNSVSWMRLQELDWSSIQSSVVIAATEFVPPTHAKSTVVTVNNPRLVFAKLLQRFAVRFKEPTIHPTTVIGENCNIPNSVSIGCFTTIGDNVTIGEDSVIRNNVTINDDMQIGDRVIIKSGAVIGEEGFGFDHEEDGSPFRVPHIGLVIIGADVEIGSLTTVCRGTLGNTEICDYAKIDDHVHIAHNVIIGERTIIAACAEISGSVIVDNDVWIGPGSVVTNGVHISKDCYIGIGTNVMTNASPGTKLIGFPGKHMPKF